MGTNFLMISGRSHIVGASTQLETTGLGANEKSTFQDLPLAFVCAFG